eukprot:gene42990-52541_t
MDEELDKSAAIVDDDTIGLSKKAKRTKSVSFQFDSTEPSFPIPSSTGPTIEIPRIEESNIPNGANDSSSGSDSDDSTDKKNFRPVFHTPQTSPDKKRGSLQCHQDLNESVCICTNSSIYDALKSKLPAFEVMRVMQQAPEACQYVDSQGNTPLHIAASFVASIEILQSLLRYYPGGVKKFNKQGQLPLHRAAAMNNAIKVVALLMKAYPEALEIADNEGNLPVHYASAFNNVFILKLCLKRSKYLFTTAVNNNEGYLPIHMCALHNSTCDKARLLIKYNPYALHMRSKHNDLP